MLLKKILRAWPEFSGFLGQEASLASVFLSYMRIGITRKMVLIILATSILLGSYGCGY